jgi:tRNA A37 threonylcarbamoyladenosine dehydratase
VGQAKIDAMRDRIAEINPACVVNCIDEFVDPDNWQQLLPADADAVIDACDQIKAKAEMAAHARKTSSALSPLVLQAASAWPTWWTLQT